MTILSALWNAWCWLPYSARVVLVFAGWFAFAELVGRFAGFSDRRFDEEIDKPIADVRDGMNKPLPRDQRRRLGTVR